MKPEYIYRVVFADDTTRKTGGWSGRQHVYLKEATAKGVVTAYNKRAEWLGDERRLKIVRSLATWEDYQ